jgi:hypothetical protein
MTLSQGLRFPGQALYNWAISLTPKVGFDMDTLECLRGGLHWSSEMWYR